MDLGRVQPDCRLVQDQKIGVIPWSPLARGLLVRPAGAAMPRREGDAKMAGELYDHQVDPGENQNVAGRPEHWT